MYGQYIKKSAADHRRCALRIASAYRTVSKPVLFVIAGVTPTDLLVSERKRIFDVLNTVPLRPQLLPGLSVEEGTIESSEFCYGDSKRDIPQDIFFHCRRWEA